VSPILEVPDPLPDTELPPTELLRDALASAQLAGLRYSHDDEPGIVRKRAGKHFRYLMDGQPVRDPPTLKRIHSLVIPTAWTSVWICGDAEGHIQAVGLLPGLLGYAL
jgi:DNA topoisomerase-1